MKAKMAGLDKGAKQPKAEIIESNNKPDDMRFP